MTNEFMDTVDPRIERAFTKTGRHNLVHVPSYQRAWARRLALTIAALVVIVIFA